jgi:adenosylcobinamide-GDP ribazoletransferase
MNSFYIAIGFFTRLPVPKAEFTEERFRRAMVLAPLVGLVIGVILVAIRLVLAFIEAPDMIAGAVLVCSYIFITGGLHFDGLADTCDGIFSGRSREQSLEIMKDSRIGVFGTLGLFMTGILYFALFTAIPAGGLLVFPLCGRACCLFSASMAPYAREEGMGKAASLQGGALSNVSAAISLIVGSLLTIPTAFISLLGTKFAVIGSGAAATGVSQLIPTIMPTNAVFILLTITSLAAGLAAVIATVFITAKIRKKLGGVTGDTFGAVIEVSSLVYLFFYIVIFNFLLKAL